MLDRQRIFPASRREFLTLLGGAVAAWPLAARAQQPQRMRRIGVLMATAANDPESLENIAGLLQGLQELGWSVGRNVRIEYRWAAGDAERIRRDAAELVALGPDVIIADGPSMRPLQSATRTIPVVFPGLVDPVGAGYVASLARPGGNITGFAGMEYRTSGKWLELLKEIVPRVTRAAVLRDPLAPGGPGQFAAIQAVASPLGVEVSPINGREADEIKSTVAAFAGAANSGLIATSSTFVRFHRELIVTLAARHRLPAVYEARAYVAAGGLISYGPVTIDMYRRVAGYVDRILRGEKPADLPVQAPVKYETVLNMKTAKALGLEVPTSILLRADEVIE